jgi:hypothetical protein
MVGHMRKFWIAGYLFWAWGVGLLRAPPPTSADQPAELRIGVLLSLSGRNQGVGQAMKEAVEQAVRDAAGRISRLPPVRLEWADDQGTARKPPARPSGWPRQEYPSSWAARVLTRPWRWLKYASDGICYV